MAIYFKVNPKVAQHLNLTDKRYQFECGNYLLWQGDLLAFGPLTEMDDILRRIGGVAMTHEEALAEQKRFTCVELPEAAEPRFRMEATAQAETVEESAEEQDVEPENDDQP